MSNVSLRVYNREIETMIEGGRLDEAVAHCQHILKTFPMYVETYRLLGKSFLEARRYTDAADIFQRTLMAVPDDFVAHVGMSIIRDDEGKLDDAIWHMERAYEDQPSNTAIQNELRRLYGRRDGTEPTKIRLSRDALANMYAQGELYHQAIAEIRGVLAEDPNRPDLQVMLARAYFRSGQKVEAAEVAANLLKKYNYCMDALRILVDVLPEASQTENTQVYRQRLHMLDPYSSFVAGSVFSTDQVPDASVNLEHLEYVAEVVSASPQPNWASTLGIKLVEEKHNEPAPDWLTNIKHEEKTSEKPVEKHSEKTPNKTAELSPEQLEEKAEIPQPVLPPVEQAPAGDDKYVPDWMRTAGWKESSGIVPEKPVELEPEKPAEPLEKADIPEWLKSMAPKGMPEESSVPEQVTAPPSSTSESDVPEWLKGLGTVAAAEPVLETPPHPSDPIDTHVFPDWLKEMDASAPAVTPAAIPEEKPELPIAQEEYAPTQLTPNQAEVQAPVNPKSPEPTWGEDTPFQPTGEPKPLKIEDDAMGWLESLAAKQGAKEEELLTKPGERAEEMPEWLRTPKGPAESPASSEPTPEAGKTLPLEPFSSSSQDLGIETPPTEEITPVEPVQEAVQQLYIPVEPEVFPTGVASIEENLILDQLPGGTTASSEVVQPVIQPEETSQPLINEGDSDAWLKNLMSAQNVPAEEMQPPEAAPSEEVPIEKPAEESPQQFSLQEDMESWKDQFGSGHFSQVEEVQAETTAPSEEIPLEKKVEVSPQPLALKDDTKAWLEGSDARQNIPVEEIKPETTAPSEEILYEKPIEGPYQTFPPDVDTDAWLDESTTIGQQPTAEELSATPRETGEAQPGWMQTPTEEPVIPVKAPGPEVPSLPQEEDITITSWLNKHDVETALGKARSASPSVPPNELPKDDLPDWLKEPEQPTAPEKEPEKSTPAEIAPKVEEGLPEWLSQAVKPTELRAESLPASDKTLGQEMPGWVDEATPVEEPPAATTPGEWISAEDKPAETPPVESAPKPPAYPVDTPLQRQILGGTGMLSRVPTEDKDAEFLSAAQTALDAKNIRESMQAYAKLIKKNRLLDEVIHDLREAIYRFPMDFSIWQMLGDASMRANRLQDALDAYTKAEELLR
jgi:hypothetical protein